MNSEQTPAGRRALHQTPNLLHPAGSNRVVLDEIFVHPYTRNGEPTTTLNALFALTQGDVPEGVDPDVGRASLSGVNVGLWCHKPGGGVFPLPILHLSCFCEMDQREDLDVVWVRLIDLDISLMCPQCGSMTVLDPCPNLSRLVSLLWDIDERLSVMEDLLEHRGVTDLLVARLERNLEELDLLARGDASWAVCDQMHIDNRAVLFDKLKGTVAAA